LVHKGDVRPKLGIIACLSESESVWRNRLLGVRSGRVLENRWICL